MPRRSIKSLLEAGRAYNEAETPEQRETAERDYLEAEEAHFRAMAVERGTNTVWQNFVAFVVTVVLIVSLALNIGLSVSTHNTATNVSDLQTSSLEAQIENCERTNDSRVASVNEKRQTIQGLKKHRETVGKQIALWEVAVAASPKGLDGSPAGVAEAFEEFLLGLHEEKKGLGEEIENKREAIEQTIAAQKGVAVRPGSPRADCAEVVPAPGS